MSATSARWAVRCEWYTTKPSPSREVAERLLAEVEKAGHCGYSHEVVEVDEADIPPCGDTWVNHFTVRCTCEPASPMYGAAPVDLVLEVDQ